MADYKATKNEQNRELLEFLWHSIIILILSIPTDQPTSRDPSMQL